MRLLPRGIPRVALVLVFLLAATGGPAAPVAAQESPATGGPMVLEMQLQGDGDAVWTVSTTIPLENESDREAFRELATAVEQGSEAGFSPGVFRRAATAASEEAGRPMAIRSVRHNATVLNATGENATGYLAMRLTWTNFARVEGDRLHVGDAFNTTNGSWLPGLSAGQSLVIRPPDDHNVVSAPIGPSAGVLRWTGPVTFAPGYLTVTYERGAFGLPTELLAGAGAVLVAVLAAALLVRRTHLELPLPTGTDGGSAGGAEAADDEAPPDAVPGETVVDEALLSDEERVERLLAENGGRMKQARIVKETGWSNAKVSQLLSAMDEDDRVDKLRIGRENLISLPDEDVGRIE